MGAWGPGNFENDSAADWLIGFKEKKSLARLKTPLEKGLADKTGDEWDEALVAAEIVSLVRGHPSKDCPEELRIWAQQNQAHPDVALVALARKFLAHIVQRAAMPEFRESFRDARAADAYIAAQKKFLKRLKFNYKNLPKVAGQAGAATPRKEPWVFIGYVKIEKDLSTSTSYDGQRLALPNLPEVVKLKPRPGSHISLELHLDFFFTPEEIEQLVRLLQRNGQHRLKLVRLSGGTYFKNRDLIAFLEKIAPHVEYLDLIITGVEFTALAGASRLSKLGLHLNKKVKGSDLTYLKNLSGLEILKITQLLKLPSGDVFSGNRKLKFLVIATEELENNRLPELPESLEELHIVISKTDRETDLSSLTRLPKLRRLGLSAQYFKPIPAAGFESLELFNPSTSVEDVSFLTAAKKLRDLEIPPLVRDLRFLEGAPELRRLRIGGGYKQDLAVADLISLEKVPNLRTFHLHHSTKIDRLPVLKKLERFEFYQMPNLKLEEITKFPTLRQLSTLSPNLSGGILEQLKAIASRVEWVDNGFDWSEAEKSKYNTYFM